MEPGRTTGPRARSPRRPVMRDAVRCIVAALGVVMISISLGACASTGSRAGGPCYTPADQRRMDNGTLDNSRLNEILDCLEKNPQGTAPSVTHTYQKHVAQ